MAKLSRLQQWILYAAYENRAGEMSEPGSAPPEVDLYYQEALAGYFSFPVTWWPERSLRESPGTHRFDREAIGRARYDAAQASLSRAVRRLEDRGLIERSLGAYSRWAGVKLSADALEAMQAAYLAGRPPFPNG